MAEAIAAGIAQTVITQLSSLALQEITSAWGVKKDVKRLENTMIAIKEMLPHAEHLQLSNNNVKSWLRRIKDAAYDAEDVVDDFATEALRRKLVMKGSITKKLRNFASSSNPLSLSFKIAHRIKEVRENLTDIFNDHQLFGLEKGYQENRGFISEESQTHSYISEGKVVGRIAETEKIVKLLLDSKGRDNVSIIPIQGMGGIGKTALAQHVYRDERVVTSFKKNRMWVCVSDEFNVQKITKKIIRSSTDKECPNLDMDQLQSRLRQHLEGKRYLLVLDDIWNEELNKWHELRELLIGGASGSKIIVTTRSERVGSLMGTSVGHRLSELSEDDCWVLFKDIAFKEGEKEADPELVKIGKDIAKKCVGVPLAAKTLGGLCFQAKKQTWEFVRDSDVWRLPQQKNGILPALMISYNHLPFYLKQCFAYCSIFPKDYEIERDILVRLWIAQGFVYSVEDNRSPEDVGRGYVELLMWRSFFQEPEVDDCDNLDRFKMHDLVHDLAQFVAGVECFSVCKDKKDDFSQGVRHVFFNVKRLSSHFMTPGLIPKPSNIRTLMFASEVDFPIDTIISSLKFLRVLQFRNDNIDHLPNSIDELKYLRYLEIEGKYIIALSDSIANLQNLEVLKLRCRKLKKLPKRIQNMISLRHIDIWSSHLNLMPRGIEELKSLQTLSHFFVGKDKGGCLLNGLNGLTDLGGSLVIHNLENVANALEESKETNLKTKRKLQRLTLAWSESVENGVCFEVLENLEPPSSLKRLEICGYVGPIFPRWMMEISPSSSLVEIKLRNCRKCKRLFPFGDLPYLKVLRLWGMDGLECIEGRPEENHNKESWFPSLTALDIWDCPNLESWFAMEAQEQVLSLAISFPSLVEVRIKDCPKLKNMPLKLPSVIENLSLYSTNAEFVHSLVLSPNSSLHGLAIFKCEGLKSWPNWLGPHLTSLTWLDIGFTQTLPFLPQQIQHLTALEDVRIYDYCAETLPEWMVSITDAKGHLVQASKYKMCKRSLHQANDYIA